MRYALARKDGGVSIMTMLPIAIIVGDEEYRDIEIKDGRLWAGGQSWPLPRDVAELQSNSIASVVLLFPAPEDEILKWDDIARASVVGIHAISAVPPDRSYRDAWKHDGKAIVHDMSKARGIHRESMRTVRAAIMARLDIEYQRADEASDARQKTAVAQRKQALRDVTKDSRIEAAATIDELKAVWPGVLTAD